MTNIVKFCVSLLMVWAHFGAYSSDLTDAEVEGRAKAISAVAKAVVYHFKGGYSIPHMSYPDGAPSIGKSIMNNASQSIKIQVIAVNMVKQFNLNSSMPDMLKNDNSTLKLQYMGPWITLEHNDVISLMVPQAFIDTEALSDSATFTKESQLKIRARILDKKQRQSIKSKYRIFDVSDAPKQSHFAIDIVNKKIKIMKID
jgi:hypothetical protein